MRSLALVVALAACARGGGEPPGGDDDTPPDAPPGEEAPIRSCATHFALHPTGAVTAVEVAGAWDWTTRAPLADPDGDGTYTLDKELPAGVWAYKLVVTRPGGAVEWIEDPGNPYRAFDGGIENSGARVDDCATPRLAIVSHAVTGALATTTFALERGKTGAAIATLHATHRFEGATSDVAVVAKGGEITVALDGLAPGKHVVAVEAIDAAGARTDAMVPFWVEAEAFDWRDALIYMVMTDRFRNGDPSNDPPRDTRAVAEADFHGGDLRGVTQAIEDGTFDALGVRALWLSPFIANTTKVELDGGHGVSAYHGYWPVKARAIDPRLGSEADLDALVTAAHRRGIRVLMDYVVNHVHRDHEYYAAHPEWFRVGCICGEPGCDWTEHRLDCSFHDYMPDVDWQRTDAGEQMLADAVWWLERFDLDGLRVDAVKHVEDLAVYNLRARIHDRFERGGTPYFLLGETAMGWNGDSLDANLPEYQTIARYVGPDALSGQFDFVLYHGVTEQVFTDDTRGMLHLDYWSRESQLQYPQSAVMTPFIGSHDSERIISLATFGSGNATVHHKWADEGLPAAPTTDAPYDRVAVAFAWELALPGAPLIYYGDEYGEHGGADPDNRHMWVAPGQRSARQNALYARVARAATLRKELPALRRGDYTPLTVTEDVLSFARTYGDAAVVVVINKATAARTIDLAISDGTLVDRMDPAGRTVTASGGHASITMAPRSSAILVRP